MTLNTDNDFQPYPAAKGRHGDAVKVVEERHTALVLGRVVKRHLDDVDAHRLVPLAGDAALLVIRQKPPLMFPWVDME